MVREGLPVGIDLIIAHHALQGVNENALAVAAFAYQEPQALLGGVARQAVTHGALQIGNHHGAFAREHFTQKLHPLRALGIDRSS